MANKLLEEIKSLGYDHEKVIDILKKAKEAESTETEEPEAEAEEEEEPEPESTPNDDKKKKSLDIDITKLSADITKKVSETVSKSVSKEIKEQLKKLRGKPPKGEESDESIGNNPFVKKNPYERRV